MTDRSSTKIEYSKWNPLWEKEWGDGFIRKKNETGKFNVNKRSKQSSFTVETDSLKSHEENLKWEFKVMTDNLNEIRKRKFFAINASMILFPGLIGGLAAIASLNDITKIEEGLQWAAVVTVSMFIGMANMIAIKYIAAFKSQSNLAIRQINCLRQALDSMTYYRFEGKFPIHLKALSEGGVYYKIFGKHRKLPVGNEGLRNRFIGSFTESADKSLIGFLFFTSTILVSAPFLYLVSVSMSNWETITQYYHYLLGYKNEAIAITLLFLVAAVGAFVFAHWSDFKHLRTGDGAVSENENPIEMPEVLFNFNKLDYIPMTLFVIPAIFWITIGWLHTKTIFSVIVFCLVFVSIFLMATCVHKVFFDSLNRINKSLISKSCFKPTK